VWSDDKLSNKLLRLYINLCLFHYLYYTFVTQMRQIQTKQLCRSPVMRTGLSWAVGVFVSCITTIFTPARSYTAPHKININVSGTVTPTVQHYITAPKVQLSKIITNWTVSYGSKSLPLLFLAVMLHSSRSRLLNYKYRVVEINCIKFNAP